MTLESRIRAEADHAPADRVDDLLFAARAAILGGRAAMIHYGAADLDVKGSDEAPVTSADRASHSEITSFLRSNRPGEDLFSEEDPVAGTRSVDSRTWIVDPLDGTREFMDRIDEFSVMVGLAEQGAAVLGAVYRPAADILYIGFGDGGAWRVSGAATDHPVVAGLRVENSPSNGIRFVRSRSHPDRRLQEIEQTLRPSRVILSGSVGTKCSLIAEGKAEIYVHPVPYLKEWDTCAPEAVLRGAGGRVTDCSGDPLTYCKTNPIQAKGIFAAHPAVWKDAATAVFHVAEEI